MNMNKYTVKELRIICKEQGLKGYSKFRKAELIEFIEKNSNFSELRYKEKEPKIAHEEAIRKLKQQNENYILELMRTVDHDNLIKLYKKNKYQKLAEKVLESLDDWSWDSISKKPLSEDFIERFTNKFNWSLLGSSNQKSWAYIGDRVQFSEAFLERNHHNFTCETWDRLSTYQKFSSHFINKFKRKINWSILSCRNEFISIDFIREFQDSIDWSVISYNILSEDIIREFKDKVDWFKITQESSSWSKREFSETFLREFPDKIDWSNIKYNRLSENFIMEFKDKVDWNYITKNNNYMEISEQFAREFHNEIDWASISYKKLSLEFLKEFQAKIPWRKLSYYNNLSESVMRGFKNKISWYSIMGSIYDCDYAIFSQDFLRDFQDKIDWSKISYDHLSENFIREFQDKVDWYEVSFQKNLSEGFIREFQDKVDWKTIMEYEYDEISDRSFSEQFIRDFEDKVDWSTISYENVSLNFIRDFKNKINWYVVALTCALSDDLLNEFGNFIVWEEVSTRKDLSIEFIRKYLNKLDISELIKNKKISDELLNEFTGYSDYYGDEKECLICHEEVDHRIITKCKHIYCEPCLLKWLENNNNCPYCRKYIRL